MDYLTRLRLQELQKQLAEKEQKPRIAEPLSSRAQGQTHACLTCGCATAAPELHRGHKVVRRKENTDEQA